MISKALILLGLCLTMVSSHPHKTEDEVLAQDTSLQEKDQATGLYTFLTCSLDNLANDIANIALETGTYFTMSYATVAKVVYGFAMCPTKLNPLDIINCFVNEAIDAYGKIQDLITSTKNFITDMDQLVPVFENDLKSCFHKSLTE